MKVQTVKGLIEIEELQIKDVVTLENTSRIMATEWRLKGLLVRRDVNINVLVGLSLTSEQTQI